MVSLKYLFIKNSKLLITFYSEKAHKIENFFFHVLACQSDSTLPDGTLKQSLKMVITILIVNVDNAACMYSMLALTDSYASLGSHSKDLLSPLTPPARPC